MADGFPANFCSPRENHMYTCLQKAWKLTDTGAYTWPGTLLFNLQVLIPTPCTCDALQATLYGSSRRDSLTPVPLVALRGVARVGG